MQHDPKDDSSDSILGPFLTAKSESISDELLRALIVNTPTQLHAQISSESFQTLVAD